MMPPCRRRRTIASMASSSQPALRPVVVGASFLPVKERLRPFLEDAEVRERRREEAAAELLLEYEAQHGKISEDELKSLDSEWLD